MASQYDPLKYLSITCRRQMKSEVIIQTVYEEIETKSRQYTMFNCPINQYR
jgi:hypothetical protein